MQGSEKNEVKVGGHGTVVPVYFLKPNLWSSINPSRSEIIQ